MSYVFSENLNKTNTVHDEIEKYYIPNVNHEEANKVKDRIMGEILV